MKQITAQKQAALDEKQRLEKERKLRIAAEVKKGKVVAARKKAQSDQQHMDQL